MTNSYFVQWLTQQKRYTTVYLLGEGGMGRFSCNPQAGREGYFECPHHHGHRRNHHPYFHSDVGYRGLAPAELGCGLAHRDIVRDIVRAAALTDTV